jgi:BirA family biotin operon repressor/biotin-[acetyl-CoA-carboxylase] ligase
MKKNEQLSSKALVLSLLREKQGEVASGSVLAEKIGVSRVAVWKTVQSLVDAGYLIETKETGYLLDPKNEKDFLYPWEFGERETSFYHYKNTGSTMDRARELALRGESGGIAVIAEKQSAGRGRYGRTWISRQGGLFFSVLERPNFAIADYSFLSIIMQIAVVRTINSVCGKKAYLRWPNDIYINRRKIAGITAEMLGEGNLISWHCTGVGVNVNNISPSNRATTCAEVINHELSRKEIFVSILDEYEKVKNAFSSHAVYSQGFRQVSEEWNSLADCIGAKAAVFQPENNNNDFTVKTGKILAKGIFSGIDPSGRCIIKTESKKQNLYFNQGSVSLAFLNV